jgi:hypothetical protein
MERYTEDVLNFRVGKCGGCGLTLRFWPIDGSEVTCPGCGAEHEVEIDTALNLSSEKETKLAWMILVSAGDRIKQLVEKN